MVLVIHTQSSFYDHENDDICISGCTPPWHAEVGYGEFKMLVYSLSIIPRLNPQVLPVSLRQARRTLFALFEICPRSSLKVSLVSRVTPRYYTSLSIYSSCSHIVRFLSSRFLLRINDISLCGVKQKIFIITPSFNQAKGSLHHFWNTVKSSHSKLS